MKKLLSLSLSLTQPSKTAFWEDTLERLAHQQFLITSTQGVNVTDLNYGPMNDRSFLGLPKSEESGGLGKLGKKLSKLASGFLEQKPVYTSVSEILNHLDYPALFSQERPLKAVLEVYENTAYMQGLEKNDAAPLFNSTYSRFFYQNLKRIIHENGDAGSLFDEVQFDSSKDTLFSQREDRAQPELRTSFVELVQTIRSLNDVEVSNQIESERLIKTILSNISTYFGGLTSPLAVNSTSVREEIYASPLMRDLLTRFGDASRKAIQEVFEEFGKDKESLLKLHVLTSMRQLEARVPLSMLASAIRGMEPFVHEDRNRRFDVLAFMSHSFNALDTALSAELQQSGTVLTLFNTYDSKTQQLIKQCVVETFLDVVGQTVIEANIRNHPESVTDIDLLKTEGSKQAIIERASKVKTRAELAELIATYVECFFQENGMCASKDIQMKKLLSVQPVLQQIPAPDGLDATPKNVFWHDIRVVGYENNTMESMKAGIERVFENPSHGGYKGESSKGDDTYFDAEDSRKFYTYLKDNISNTSSSFSLGRFKSKQNEKISHLMGKITALNALSPESSDAGDVKALLKNVLVEVLTSFKGKVDPNSGDGSVSIRDAILLMPQMVGLLTKFGEVSCKAITEVFELCHKNMKSLAILYAHSSTLVDPMTSLNSPRYGYACVIENVHATVRQEFEKMYKPEFAESAPLVSPGDQVNLDDKIMEKLVRYSDATLQDVGAKVFLKNEMGINEPHRKLQHFVKHVGKTMAQPKKRHISEAVREFLVQDKAITQTINGKTYVYAPESTIIGLIPFRPGNPIDELAQFVVQKVGFGDSYLDHARHVLSCVHRDLRGL